MNADEWTLVVAVRPQSQQGMRATTVLVTKSTPSQVVDALRSMGGRVQPSQGHPAAPPSYCASAPDSDATIFIQPVRLERLEDEPIMIWSNDPGDCDQCYGPLQDLSVVLRGEAKGP